MPTVIIKSAKIQSQFKMKSKVFARLLCCAILSLKYQGSNGGITLLLEKSQNVPTGTNSSTLYSQQKEQSDLSSSSKVAHDTLKLTRDNELQSLWRTQEGELVELFRVKGNDIGSRPSDRYSEQNRRQSSVALESKENVISADKLDMSPLPSSSSSSQASRSGRSRMPRTFWPFVRPFGYDYDYDDMPRPNPFFGPPIIPPSPFGFGGGFGVGMPPPPPMMMGPYGMW